MSDGDAIRAALRYRLERFRREELGEEPAEEAAPTRTPTDADRVAAAEIAMQQALRRGDFENLPGAGKPLPGIGDGRVHDPDWWIRRKIEREQLRGIGPAAFTLRAEDAGLDARLDTLIRAEEVRAALEDFNRRVIEARRQLLGGPPVITPLRDVEAELAAWAERRRPLPADSATQELPADAAASAPQRDASPALRDARLPQLRRMWRFGRGPVRGVDIS
ncbi:DUF1992 domain-containing protein [Protaetiibacter larvae]|uniref:DUF1992 domain-containing protein n=1 Tax=Protaetiibacter larvae TaxID=2592654 RepID=A0A5C1YBA2_9MICO|nr:DUF1992 domain-containing protein [Protaetiibacter larvae]QEO10738.1 DUF1992 domain-containing protein [Protaetiibacter larvae]